MEALERLAIADAFIKRLKQVEKDIRDEVDAETLELCDSYGVDRREVKVAGQKVGTIGVRRSKAVKGTAPAIEDPEAFAQWFRESDGGMDAIRRLVDVKPDLMLEAATVDGELPDGCTVRSVDEPSRVLGTTLRVDQRKVADALQGRLAPTMELLLGGE